MWPIRDNMGPRGNLGVGSPLYRAPPRVPEPSMPFRHVWRWKLDVRVGKHIENEPGSWVERGVCRRVVHLSHRNWMTRAAFPYS